MGLALQVNRIWVALQKALDPSAGRPVEYLGAQSQSLNRRRSISWRWHH